MTKQSVDLSAFRKSSQRSDLEEFLIVGLENAIKELFERGATEPDDENNPFTPKDKLAFKNACRNYPHLWEHTLNAVVRGRNGRPPLAAVVEEMIQTWGIKYKGEEDTLIEAVAKAKASDIARIAARLEDDDDAFAGLHKWTGFVSTRVRLYAVHCVLCMATLAELWEGIAEDVGGAIDRGNAMVDALTALEERKDDTHADD